MGEGPPPARRYFGYALAGIGALIVMTVGLCTGGMLLSLILDMPGTGGDADGNYTWGSLLLFPIVGGIPLAVGLFLAIAGWRMATRR